MARPRPDGRATVVVADDRSIDAIAETRHLSTVLAIARVARARRVIDDRHGGHGVVVYHCRATPPIFLLDAVTAAGGVVFDGTREHTSPRPQSVTVQLDSAFCDLGTVVRRRLKAPDFGFALDLFEARVRRERPGLHWPTILELVALAGEVLREVRYARWVLAPEQRLPFALDQGVAGMLSPGPLAQAIADGDSTSLRTLMPLAKDPQPVYVPSPPVMPRPRPRAATPAPAPAPAARMMPLLCDRTKVALDTHAWTPLVDTEVDRETMPVIVWVEDRGDALRWPPRDEVTADVEARARANIDTLAVTLTPLDVPELRAVVVTGDYFAAETILSPTTMERVRGELGGARTLLVGTPARGHLIATDAGRALIDDDLMTAFLIAVERAYL